MPLRLDSERERDDAVDFALLEVALSELLLELVPPDFSSSLLWAEEALALGLTNWVCEPEELMDRTLEIAGRLASGPVVAYRYMKENLNRAMSGEVDDCLDLEATHHVHTGFTEDHKEAAKAFVEKREPLFQGR